MIRVLNREDKILVDSISLLFPLTGIGRYTYEVSKQLEEDNSLLIEYFYGYYYKKLIQLSSSKEIKGLKSFILKNPMIKKMVRKILLSYVHLFSKSYELYWQPNFIPNSGIKAKKIVTTVHDFSFILYRDFHPKERIEYIEKYFFNNLDRSDMIITGSEYTKREILKYTKFKEDKIVVIYHGIDHNLFKVYQKIELGFDLPSKFILSVGSIEPRKNLLRLLKAYQGLPLEIKDEYKLLLVGFSGWENSEIISLIKELEEYVQYLGFISDEELAQVYNLATLFVYPSLYEGFGLPVLEAMACGTAVVSSGLSSLPEVGGDAPLYCDPYSITDIQEKIVSTLADSSKRDSMVEKGLAQAQKFSWQKSAQEHKRVFKLMLN